LCRSCPELYGSHSPLGGLGIEARVPRVTPHSGDLAEGTSVND